FRRSFMADPPNRATPRGFMDRPPARPHAVLVGVQLPDVSDVEHAADLAELGRLGHTLGLDVGASARQRREARAAAAVLGEGKLKELAHWTGGKGVVPSGAKPKKTKARARWAATGDGTGGESDEADEGDDEDADDRDERDDADGDENRPSPDGS